MPLTKREQDIKHFFSFLKPFQSVVYISVIIDKYFNPAFSSTKQHLEEISFAAIKPTPPNKISFAEFFYNKKKKKAKSDKFEIFNIPLLNIEIYCNYNRDLKE